MVAPLLAPLVDDDDAFLRRHGMLLRKPERRQFPDELALSLPCQHADELPVGLMVWSTAGRDDVVLDAGLAIESRAARDADAATAARLRMQVA